MVGDAVVDTLQLDIRVFYNVIELETNCFQAPSGADWHGVLASRDTDPAINCCGAGS